MYDNNDSKGSVCYCAPVVPIKQRFTASLMHPIKRSISGPRKVHLRQLVRTAATSKNPGPFVRNTRKKHLYFRRKWSPFGRQLLNRLCNRNLICTSFASLVQRLLISVSSVTFIACVKVQNKAQKENHFGISCTSTHYPALLNCLCINCKWQPTTSLAGFAKRRAKRTGSYLSKRDIGRQWFACTDWLLQLPGAPQRAGHHTRMC